MIVNHMVAMPISATSHLRQHLHLIFNILQAHPSVIVTICMASSTRITWDNELNATSYNLDGFGDRWRIVELDDKACEDSVAADVKGINREIEIMLLACKGPTFEKILLAEGESTKWSTRPCLIIPDSFIGAVRDTVRAICADKGQKQVPVVPFISTMAIALRRVYNDTSHYGVAEGMMWRYEKYRAEGMDECEASRKAFRFVHNARLEWPDLPPMFDYEWTPQTENINMDIGPCRLFQKMWNNSHNADGFICVSDPEIDGHSIEAQTSILGLPLMGVGPQMDPVTWNPPDTPVGQHLTENDKVVLNFLDHMQGLHGPRSVVYISFGTIIWPTLRSDIVQDMIDTLLEQGIPFVIATASPEGKLDEKVKEKIETTGLGLVRDWVPQVRVLQHPATFTFITHCGMGSIMEAIVAQVPILTMPFYGDMAALGAHFTQVRRIGIPLDHFSANAGLKLGNGTIVQDSSTARQAELAQALQTLRSSEGEGYRLKLQEVKNALLSSRKSGPARDGLLAVSRWFTMAT